MNQMTSKQLDKKFCIIFLNRKKILSLGYNEKIASMISDDDMKDICSRIANSLEKMVWIDLRFIIDEVISKKQNEL